MDHQDITDVDNIDEVMLPGFRFHPTDEELVGFYLRRKIQHKPLSIELIKQIDIYKYDPWDLPKLATSGEKEWYFYCPRDRKYRNSARPNRVTGAGFWKATGTDRPIYSSEGSKCIGLKKSLVFYKGRAAKGIKTDWMMHEFRLPTVSDSLSPKRFLDKNIPANEAWAICRIFKKANSSKKRALSHSWVSPIFETTTASDMINLHASSNTNFSNSTLTIEKMNTPLQFGFCNDILQQSSFTSFSPIHVFPPVYQTENKPIPNGNHLITTSYTITSTEKCEPATKCLINDASSLLQDMSTSIFGSDKVDFSTCDTFSAILQAENTPGEEGLFTREEIISDDQFGAMMSSFPLSSPEAWKTNLFWDSSSPCISELSTSYSTNKCYT